MFESTSADMKRVKKTYLDILVIQCTYIELQSVN